MANAVAGFVCTRQNLPYPTFKFTDTYIYWALATQNEFPVPSQQCACWSGPSDLCKLCIQHVTTCSVYTFCTQWFHPLLASLRMLSGQYNWVWDTNIHYTVHNIHISQIFKVMGTAWCHAARFYCILTQLLQSKPNCMRRRNETGKA